ncbi:MAG: nuclear transport factor 2 family protein [Haloplanus sp.]
MPDETLTREEIETTIREYFEACNAGDVEEIASFFAADAVHYFPPGMYEGPFEGGQTIGERWAKAVDELGSVWTVDRITADPENATAVMEWTHFKTDEERILRGDEWYDFDPETGLIEEIRAYYAAPEDPDLDRNELGGFDYAARGYPVESPLDRDGG